MDPLISAILDAVFAALTEAVGLSDWLRQRLQGDPEKLAFRAALTQALTAAAARFHGRDIRYFAEVLPQISGPLLVRYLQPAATLPTADELTQLWLNHLTIDSPIHYRQAFAEFATFLLDQLAQQLENQQPLQWIVQARWQRSNEEATRRLAEAAMQEVATLDALRQDVIQLTAALETALKSNSSTVSTAGGAYVAGNVSAHHFAGRDLTIKNYFVNGLARLVIDYGPRIQDFLLEYLGSKRKRVPFGGRQAQLDELHTWLDDPAAPPYYLMTAEAGRGKSALVCRWLAQLTSRPDLDVIFVPISLRFETATQDVVFAALAARLANLYENEPEKLPPAALTAEQWKGVCQSYLRRSPPEGKQLLVILDGLDEATGWTPGRGLFSADPPPGLRVLVTARTRPSETGASGWATTLGWDDPLLARTATLPGLQRRGMEEALASMGNPLDTLATKVDVVGELHRLSEGDPLLVRLYVDALLAQGPAVTTLCAEDLQHIQPGLAGYFERWWQDQQEQWRIQGRDPIMEQAQLRLLLNALAAALGPLRLDDLAALHPDLADSLLVRRLLQQVSRWLVGDGKTQGYSYSHSRLGYYFWEQLGEHEQQMWDECFVTWGKRILVELNVGTLAPKRAPHYLLLHYADHLQHSHALAPAFYALVSDGWRQAWAELDISFGGFLNDIEFARQQAIQAYTSHPPRRVEALIQPVVVALCRASVDTLGHNLQPELLAQLVKEHLYTPTQALAIVKLVADEERQSRLLIGLIDYLPHELLGEALHIAQAITDVRSRAAVLCALVLHLPESDRRVMLDEALRTDVLIDHIYHRTDAFGRLAPHLPDVLLWRAQAIDDASVRAKVLSTLAPYLPHELLGEALHIAQAITDVSARATVLSALIPHLPENERKAVFEDALQASQAISDVSTRATVLSVLAPYLPENKRRIAFDGALHAALTLDEGEAYFHAKVLCILAPYMPESERREALAVALHDNPTIYYTSFRSAALSKLAPHLPRELLDEALRAAQAIDDASARANALCGLAPYLPDELLGEALRTAQAIDSVPHRAAAFCGLAPHLPDTLVAEVLQAIQGVDFGTFYRATVLCALAPHRPGELIKEALRAAQAIERCHPRARTLCALVPYLSKSECRAVLREALRAAQTIGDASARVVVLRVLLSHLPESERRTALEEALRTAQAIDDVSTRAAALRELVPHQPESERRAALEEALQTAQIIDFTSTRATALIELAPHLPWELLGKALHSAQTIDEARDRATALCGLVPYLPQELLGEALQSVLTINAAPYRAIAIRAIAPYLPDKLLGKALQGAQAVGDIRHRASALKALAPYLPDELLGKALRAAPLNDRGVTHFLDYVDVLSAVAPYLPRELHGEALGIARAINAALYRATALREMVPHLPESERRVVLEQALRASQAIGGAADRANALSALSPHLPESERRVVLEQALRASQATEVRYRADAIRRLAPHLPRELLSEALCIAQAIDDVRYRADALCGLAPHLPQELLGEALQSVQVINFALYRADALCGLVPHLPRELLREALCIAQAIDDVRYRANALRSLVPYLPESERRVVLEEALQASQATDDIRYRINAIRELAPYLSDVLLGEALQSVESIDFASDRSGALSVLAPYLPDALLGRALHIAKAINFASARTNALSALAPHLLTWIVRDTESAYSAITDALVALGERPRPEFLADLAILMPTLFALAGDEAPQVAKGIFQAIQEICAWWP